MKNVVLALTVALSIVACGSKDETQTQPTTSTTASTEQHQYQPAQGEPTDQVADFDNMVIYAIVVNPTPGPGKTYMYWVRDNSDRGWTFISDKKYNIGDRLAIVQVPSLPPSATATTPETTTDTYQ